MNKNILIGAVVMVIIVGGAMLFFGQQQSQEDQEPQQNQDQQPNGTTGALAEPSAVYAADQQPAESVSVGMVVLEQAGYAVIHEDSNGSPGAILGASSYLEAGEHQNVAVALSRPAQNGEVLYAMLHTDNGDGAWNAADDAPVQSADGGIILIQFNISTDANIEGEIML